MFHHMILAFAVLGVVINVVAFIIITKKKDKSMFHDLLKILTAYDVGVVICCAFQFAFPNLWPAYVTNIYPHIMPYLLPVMHITVLTSVYSTILISFERYIRICFYCQLRETSVLSEDNVKYYKLFVILFPILFYIPKCFEVRSHYVVREVKMRIDCQKYLSLSELLENPLLKSFIGQQFTEAELVKIEFLAEACNNIIRQELSEANSDDNTRGHFTHNSSIESTSSFLENINPTISTGQPPPTSLSVQGEQQSHSSPEPMFRNVTTSTKHILLVEPTSLRRNPYYFQIYYVYLNTIFASILPLVLLLFFNINTAKELFKMSRLETRSLATTRASSMRMQNRRSTRVNFNSGDKASGDCNHEDVKTALEIAAKAHGVLHHSEANLNNLPSNSSDPLLDHQSCGCATQALPVITLTADDTVVCRNSNGGPILPRPTNETEMQAEPAHEEPLSPEGSEILTTELNGVTLGRGIESRRSTITFLVQARCEIGGGVSTIGSPKRSESHPQFLEVKEGGNEDGPVTNIETISANGGGSNNNVRLNSLDRGWNGLRLSARRRASSVWSSNSTALRLSLNHALGSRAVGRRPTSLSVGLHHHQQQNSNSPPFSSRRQSTSETKKELRLARISLCIVWLFLFCHVWKLVPTFYSTFLDDTSHKDEDKALGISVEWPDWLHVVENISHTLITLNSSLNFLIYIVL